MSSFGVKAILKEISLQKIEGLKTAPKFVNILHCVSSIRIRSFSGPYFQAFKLNTERYGVSLGIQSECGKIRTRKTPTLFIQC